MTDDFPRPLGRDDQPTDAGDDERLDKLPGHEIDDTSTIGGGLTGSGGTSIDRGTGTLGGQAEGVEQGDDEGMLPSIVEFDDHERFDVDDARKPGVDDYTD